NDLLRVTVCVEMFIRALSCSIYSLFFFFSSRRRHTRSTRDWSSDVCSSDLVLVKAPKPVTLFERLTKGRAPRKAPEAQKPEEPALPAPPPAQEPVAEKAKPRGVDTFEEGAIECGSKRERERGEPTG